MLSFTFNGKDSYTDYGILMETRPHITSSKRRVFYTDVPGRSSSLRRDEETYEDITVSVECSLKLESYQRIDDIKAWLLGAGESDLVFSFQNDRKYIAQVVNSVDFSLVMKMFTKFVILFNCQPFKYGVDNVPIIITSDTTLMNPGTVSSLPIIKVNSLGAGSVTVNGNSVFLSNIVDTAILNSEIQETYKDTGTELINKNATKTGGFPVLTPGINTISFAGGITSIEITPNWRWL